jgi:hypothetical protein
MQPRLNNAGPPEKKAVYPIGSRAYSVTTHTMKDIDRSKLYDSRKEIPHAQSPDISDPKKELLMLQARLEKATGEERIRIQEQIEGITDKLKGEGKMPPTA